MVSMYRPQVPQFGQPPRYTPGPIGGYYGGSPPPTPQQARYTIGLPGATPPARYGYPGGSGINDPTLDPGTSYFGGGGGGGVPTGALPIGQFGSGGNINMMYQKGYRRKFINGQWYLVPPTQGAPQPGAYTTY